MSIAAAALSSRTQTHGRWRAYSANRPAFVPWLGTTPDHWNEKRLKYAVRLVNQKTDDTEGLPYVGLENIESWTGRYIEPDTPVQPDGMSNVFTTDDVLFGKLRPYLAKVLHARDAGVCTSEALVLRPTLLHPRFLLYWMLNRDLVSVVDGSTYGSKMPRANWEFIGNLPTCIPPIDEQRTIAAFLDRETVRIDTLIEKKQRLIHFVLEKQAAILSRYVTEGVDDFPSQPTGIASLGHVPTHWQMMPLKFVARLQTGVTLGKKYDADQPLVSRPYLRVANVQDGYLDLDEITEIELPVTDVARYRLRNGDVLLTEGGDFDKLGRGYVWEGQMAECLHQNHVFAVRPNASRLDSRYLALLLSSSHGKSYFTSTSNQTTNLASTNSTKLMRFPVPLPPLDEQHAILAAAARNVQMHDRLVTAARDGVAKLGEYRSALISATVTGKIDVRICREEETCQ